MLPLPLAYRSHTPAQWRGFVSCLRKLFGILQNVLEGKLCLLVRASGRWKKENLQELRKRTAGVGVNHE